jgi:hypothetical protein
MAAAIASSRFLPYTPRRTHQGTVQGVAGQTVSDHIGKVSVKTPDGVQPVDNVWIIKKGKYSLAAVSVLAQELKLNLLFDDVGVYLLKLHGKKYYEKVERIGYLQSRVGPQLCGWRQSYWAESSGLCRKRFYHRRQ